MKSILLLFACATLATANTILITEVNSNANGGDFFELHNYGASPVNINGWGWTDDQANFQGNKIVTFGDVTIPAGGILVVVQAADDTVFRAAWNDLDPAIATTAVGGPGLGGNDAVVLFDADGDFVTGFNYKTGNVTVTQGDTTTVTLSPFTKIDGNPSSGGHAGPAAGGGNNAVSAVWDPNSGTASPRYTFAAVGSLSAYAQTGSGSSIGSPGVVGTGVVGNAAPVFSSSPRTFGVEGFDLSNSQFFVTASDPNPGDVVTLSVEEKPEWLNIDLTSGAVTGTPPAKGDYTLVIRATDDAAPPLFTEQTITITVFPESSTVLLNEYNAVSASNYPGGGTLESPTTSDTFFGRILGNGGEWFELVVVGDGTAGSTVDMRGWKVEVLGDLGSRTMVLSQDPYWANVAAGTLLSFITNNAANGGADTEIHKTSVLHDQGFLWSNIWLFDPIFIDQAASDFNNRLGISNSDTNIIIRDAGGEIIFGPAGEGIATGGEPPDTVGVGSDEVLKLEANPEPFIDPFYSPYNDGSTSTFGGPNVWSGGANSQSFAAYQTANSPPQFTSAPVTRAYGSYSYAITTGDPNGHSVTLSATELPDFLTLTPGAGGTATLELNRALTVADAGFHTVRLVANDGQAANNLTPQAFLLTVFHDTPTVILNEYNAVSAENFLGDEDTEAVDTHFGRVQGNGGDWVEFVVVGDGGPGTVDMRGWVIEIGTSRAGTPFETSNTLTLSQDAAWAAVRAGTILTFTASNTAGGGLDTGFNLRDRSTTLGDSWSNVWMGDSQYLSVSGATVDGNTVTDIRISADDTQFMVKDSLGQIVNGPVGEGIAPTSGISSTEIFELEGDPSPSVAPFVASDDTVEPPVEGYDDGSTGSTFGSPNEWKIGAGGDPTSQDFTSYASAAPEDPFDTWIASFDPPPSDLTKLGDPDGDGRSNYEEYAFGGDPRFHDAPPAQTVIRTGADIVWSFAVRDDAGIEYTPKRSPDLTQWFEFTAPQTDSVAHPDLPGFLLITITASADPTEGKEFVRVELVIP
jgi:hypothetical protein